MGRVGLSSLLARVDACMCIVTLVGNFHTLPTSSSSPPTADTQTACGRLPPALSSAWPRVRMVRSARAGRSQVVARASGPIVHTAQPGHTTTCHACTLQAAVVHCALCHVKVERRTAGPRGDDDVDNQPLCWRNVCIWTFFCFVDQKIL